jgi:hypothetical protein
MTTTTQRTQKIRAGTFREDGRRYAVILEYREQPAQALRNPDGRTIAHEPVPADALEVAITGEVWRATEVGNVDRRFSDGQAFGQILEDLRKVPGVRAARITELWDRWHLNGMRAACEHQTERAADIYRRMPNYSDNDARWSELRSLPCPQGYSYGSAWLYEPIPTDVLDELRRLFAPPTPYSEEN